MTQRLIRSAGAGVCTLLLALALACDSGSATSTPIAPTATTAPPAATTAPPTAAPALPTDTVAPPADTVAPATSTAAPPADTAAPTLPPLATVTAAPAVDTPAPPPPAATDTPAPPVAATNTPAPPPPVTTDTPPPPAAAPTDTTVPPVDTAVRPAPTDTAEPAVATGTPNPQPPTPNPQTGLPPGRVPGDMNIIDRAPTGKHQIALTFDAGAGTGHVPEILADLARYNAHITFFVTGQWAEQNPDDLRAIMAAGDEVANHSYSHPSFPTLTDAQMIDELQHTERIIQGITGVTTKPYWRPPFGDYTRHVLDVARAQGYRAIYWTWDSLDSVGKPKTSDFILKRVTEGAFQLDGAIVLQHVAADASAQALPAELARLYARGLRVVTISQLLQP